MKPTMMFKEKMGKTIVLETAEDEIYIPVHMLEKQKKMWNILGLPDELKNEEEKKMDNKKEEMEFKKYLEILEETEQKIERMKENNKGCISKKNQRIIECYKMMMEVFLQSTKGKEGKEMYEELLLFRDQCIIPMMEDANEILGYDKHETDVEVGQIERLKAESDKGKETIE